MVILRIHFFPFQFIAHGKVTPLENIRLNSFIKLKINLKGQCINFFLEFNHKLVPNKGAYMHLGKFNQAVFKIKFKLLAR